MNRNDRDFVDLTSNWIASIRSIQESRAQLNWRGILVVLGFVAVLYGTVSLAHAFALVTNRPAHSIWPNLLSFVFSTLMFLWVWQRGSLMPWMTLALLVPLCGLSVMGSVINGELALMGLAGIVVLLHVLLAPTTAALLSLTTLVLDTVVVKLWHPEASLVIVLRAAGTSFALLVFLQLTMRHWTRMFHRFHLLGVQMSQRVEEMESMLDASRDERSAAHLTDMATGLPNRQGFLEQAQQWIEQQTSSRCALVVSCAMVKPFMGITGGADTDRRELKSQVQIWIKRLHETYGHETLMALTDEQQLLVWIPLEQVGPEVWTDRASLTLTLLQGLTGLPAAQHSAGTFGALVGVSRWPEDGDDAMVVTQAAESARIWAEHSPETSLCWFDAIEWQDAALIARQTGEIHLGLARREFELYYQPIVDASGRVCRKFEALIRWNHPVRGRLSPAEFIPVAERSELIVDITDWVLRESARQFQAWSKVMGPDLQISVNLPPIYLERLTRDPQRVIQGLRELGIPPAALVLEITEGAMLTADAEMLGALRLLREAGFLLAMDDFGIGYSSFRALSRLPLNFLKIDKSFVDWLSVPGPHRAVCQAIVEMAHGMGVQVVAEGVERVEQKTILRELGCEYMQGYFWSQPLPARDAQAWALAHTGEMDPLPDLAPGSTR